MAFNAFHITSTRKLTLNNINPQLTIRTSPLNSSTKQQYQYTTTTPKPRTGSTATDNCSNTPTSQGSDNHIAHLPGSVAHPTPQRPSVVHQYTCCCPTCSTPTAYSHCALRTQHSHSTAYPTPCSPDTLRPRPQLPSVVHQHTCCCPACSTPTLPTTTVPSEQGTTADRFWLLKQLCCLNTLAIH
jgi:hypothetical protein